MSDVLSQEEINQLIEALMKGEVKEEDLLEKEEEKKVKPYDFKRPSKFSKEQLRTFQMIHENFGRTLSTYLSGRLRTFVDVQISIDQLTYEEFIRSVMIPSFIVIFTGDVFEGSAIFEMRLDLFYTILDILMGGPGDNPPNRTPTDIEISIMRKEVTSVLTLLAQAWSDFQYFIPSIENVETNPQFVQIVPPNEIVLLVTASVSWGEFTSFINVCYPFSLLEPFLEKLSNRFWMMGRKPERLEERIEELKTASQRIPLTVQAVIGETQLTLREILDLSEGDVIRLNTHYKDDIRIDVEGRPKFKGTPGKYKGKYAVKVTGEFTNGGEEE
ncbi:flagellar motor switch protein FliM [Thermotoga sp. KOL6]|uniref:flagellar motor switch protein FliM n=1 Tax=Thermotoga sp. KOL6 TaxID=126741 RepID=UPI000C781731|nr:flagellar motor switch protein FliM [Thermotoga sp. KOL6]PLV59379.1 flagellar motor switch protein FliM [Thermotoga sp. KOL6]